MTSPQNPNIQPPFPYQNAYSSPNPSHPPAGMNASPYPPGMQPRGLSPYPAPPHSFARSPEVGPFSSPSLKAFPEQPNFANGPVNSNVNGASGLLQVNGQPSWPSPRMPGPSPNQKLASPNQFANAASPYGADAKAVPKLSQVPSTAGLPLPPHTSSSVTSSPQVTPGTSRPSNSSLNLPNVGGSTAPQRNSVDGGRSMMSPYPAGMPAVTSSPAVGLQPATPQSANPRPRYPQQVGYNQISPSPVMSQPNSLQPPNSTTFNNSSPYQQPPTSMYNSPSQPPYNNSSPQPLTPGYNSSPQPQGPGYNTSQASNYNSSPQPRAPGYNSSPQPPPAPGFNSSPQPPVSGYNSSPQPPVSGYNSSPQPQAPGYNSSPQPPSMGYNSSPGYQQQQQYQGGLPEGPVGGVAGYDAQLHAKMAGMSVHSSFSRLWGNDSINLLQDRNILPPVPLEAPKPVLTPERPNCSPDIFRCTLTKIPDSSSLLQKSRLPFGILLHPFQDETSLSVVQCNSIVRCRNCRTYINPFVTFVDQRRWKCNLCFRINDLAEEFLYDPVTRSYGDPSRRPEVRNATIEFIAPSDYMLRPPQPAAYLFVLDVSHGAVETGYLETFCKILLENIDELPGDSRTRVGFMTFDGSIQFYNLGEGLNQPHMLVVSDIEDVFLPSPDSLLVNLHESRTLIGDLLTDLPKRFASNGDTNNCLGAALQVAFKLMSPIGGRVSVFQTCLPNHGPGSLKNREDPNQRAGKDVSNIGPANDFYKKLALDCSGQQIAVDLFLLCSQYVDLATVSGISKYSSGCIQYYPGFHHQLGKMQVARFAGDLKRYLTRRIGFEAVMRIRCTRGLAIHTFHGNFFVRSTDLLSLPNVNPDTGYGMQIAIEESLTEYNTVCFQAAVLYTSSKGERRIRVHTLSLPVVSLLQDVLGGADQETIIGLVAKMAVDRSITSSLTDARDALINVCLDVLGVYKSTVAGQVAGALMAPYSARLVPLFILALLKHMAFRTGVSTKLDERLYAMERMKALPLKYLMKYIYPTLYPVHALDEKNAIHQDDDAIIPQPVILQLSSEKIDRHGAYILDTFDVLYLYVGRAISDHFCTNVLDVPNFSAIPEDLVTLPTLSTPESERMRNFVTWLQEQRPFYSPLKIIREDSKERFVFLQYMLDDRTESLFSYYEFLQHIRQQISK